MFLQTLTADEPLLWLGSGQQPADPGRRFPRYRDRAAGRLDGLQIDGDKAHVEAGVACAKVARECARAGLTGAAFLAGIPGTMGGALAMNAGAFGGETWPIVEGVTTIDRASRARAPACGFRGGLPSRGTAGGRMVRRLYAAPRAWRCGTGTGSDPRAAGKAGGHSRPGSRAAVRRVPAIRPATMPHA